MYQKLFAGVDGAQGGWLICSVNEDSFLQFDIYSSLLKLYHDFRHYHRIFIDMPIGIPAGSKYPRKCDRLAKKLLKHRHSTIFYPPCREALYQADYLSGLNIHREHVGKGFSKQAWNITPKIKEIDQVFRENPESRAVFFESHPELCFFGLNHNFPLNHSKHTLQGISTRKHLLRVNSPKWQMDWDVILSTYTKNQVKQDDLLDAWVLCLAASLEPEKITKIPKHTEFDSYGLPMTIHYISYVE